MRDSKGRFIKGYKPLWSTESRKKVSDSMIGVNTWMRGRKLSKKTRERMSRNNAKYWQDKKRPKMTGRLHPNWKEVKIEPLQEAIRGSFKYQTWRKNILKRDGSKCLLCENNKELHVDHYPKTFLQLIMINRIENFNEAIGCEDLWELDAGRTLCSICHRKTNTWGKKVWNDIV